MKKKIWITVSVLLVAFIAYNVYGLLTTKKYSPFKETTYNYQGTDITVKYCQPFKKGRIIFGDESEESLLNYGNYWRLGANEATEIAFSTDVNFGGAKVPAGSYRMYTVIGKDSWEVSLNSELGKWGAFEPDYTLDIAKVNVDAAFVDNVVEQLTINFDSDSTGMIMTFEWDKTVVTIPISN